MNNYRNELFDPLVRFAESDRKKQTGAALNHWFVRNKGVARKAWPVTYEPTYQYEKLQCPPGIDQNFWDTLDRADYYWHKEPVKDQSIEDPPYYWHEQFVPEPVSTDTGEFTPTFTNLKSMEASEAVSADEQLAAEEKLALEAAMQQFKNEALEIAEAQARTTDITALKKVIAFKKSRTQWQRAGNW